MNKKIANNAYHLYIITIVKLLVPFIVMPYLSRVLSVNQYAAHVYIRGVATFVNLGVDYGFIYSSTEEIVKSSTDRKKIQNIINDVTSAKIILSCFAIVIAMFLILSNSVSSNYMGYAGLTFASACIINLLPDYLFRGLECMSILSERMLVSKIVTTLLLFILVRSEKDFIFVACLEMMNVIISLIMTLFWLKKKKLDISLNFSFEGAKKELIAGFDYFISTIAPSLYGALNTIVVGYCLSDFEIVYWGTSWNIISAIMTLYLPISNAIFPTMVKNKDIYCVKRLFIYFLPVIVIGCLILLGLSKFIFNIMVGVTYIDGYYSLIMLLPVIVLSFISIMLGAPVLGAYGDTRNLKMSVLIAAAFHILGLLVLWTSGIISLTAVAVLRCLTELVCAIYRGCASQKFFRKYSNINTTK